MSTDKPARTCALCGEPLLPGEAKLVPVQFFEDDQGRELGPRERQHQQAIHARCMLANPEAADRHARTTFEEE